MTNPFDFFKEIYCINLKYRTDRWNLAKKEFEKVGILNKVAHYAVEKDEDSYLGLIKHHLHILKGAKKRGIENVLIFEDDVMFLDKYKPLETLRKATEQIKNMEWNLFYLSATLRVPLIKKTENLSILKCAFAAHSIAYNQSIYDKFIDYAENLKSAINEKDRIDVFLADNIQKNNTALICEPIITTQRPSYSDLEEKYVNYDFIVERYKRFKAQ